MSGIAIVMMLVSMLVLWGGLALAVLNLARNSREEKPEGER